LEKVLNQQLVEVLNVWPPRPQHGETFDGDFPLRRLGSCFHEMLQWKAAEVFSGRPLIIQGRELSRMQDRHDQILQEQSPAAHLVRAGCVIILSSRTDCQD
jgi:hypothetical protein